MECVKRKAESSTSKHDEALPKKCAHTQIFWTSYTTQWPCVVPAWSKLSCYAHSIVCDEDFSIGHGGGNDVRRHVELNKHKANRQRWKKNLQYI